MKRRVKKPIPPLTHSGNSANIDFYRCQAESRQYLVEVLCNAVERSATGKLTLRRVPVYSVTVRRWAPGAGGTRVIAQFPYRPATKPRGGRLPDRTVTQLVRKQLGPQ